MALIVGPMNLGSTAIWGVFVLYAVAPGPLGLDEIGFGVLSTSLAVGTVLGMLVASRLDRWLGRPNLFVACILSLLVQDLVFIVIPNAIAVGVTLALTGAVTGSFNVIFGSLRQRIVPNHLLGRVMASFRIISWGSLPLGALLGGIVGQTFGLTAVFITAAVIHGLLLFSRLILNDQFMAEVEEQARANVAAQAAEPEPALVDSA
jgi:MFS family permease